MCGEAAVGATEAPGTLALRAGAHTGLRPMDLKHVRIWVLRCAQGAIECAWASGGIRGTRVLEGSYLSIPNERDSQHLFQVGYACPHLEKPPKPVDPRTPVRRVEVCQIPLCWITVSVILDEFS